MSSTVLILTRQCQFRCPYCLVHKSESRMDAATLEKTVRMATHESNPVFHIQFFGGEPLLEKQSIKRCVQMASAIATEQQRPVSFFLTTNGLELDLKFTQWMAEQNFSFELSFDGYGSGWHLDSKSSRTREISRNIRHVLSTHAPCFATMVVTPDSSRHFREHFERVLETGVKSVNISPATGIAWDKPAIDFLARGLWDAYREFVRGKDVRIVNVEKDPETMLFSREITVDCDGTIYSGNAFLYAPAEAGRGMILGHVNQGQPTSYYSQRRLELAYYVENVFSRALTLNYYEIVKIMKSFRAYILGHEKQQEGELQI